MKPALTDFQLGLQAAARIAEGYAIEGIDKKTADKLDELVAKAERLGAKRVQDAILRRLIAAIQQPKD